MTHQTLRFALDAVEKNTGIVIPVYMPETDPIGSRLLDDTVAACIRHVADPASICLSVDGVDCGREIVNEIASKHGVSVAINPINKGKLHAVRLGLETICGNHELKYFAVMDSDGDHFANELPNLIRAAQFAGEHTEIDEVVVIGRRVSKTRPLGFFRGELEELADRVLLDALYFQAAVSQQPLRLEGATTIEEYPDFHSGFKVFSRGAALATFTKKPILCGVTEEGYYRHACEAVMAVEALNSGAFLILVNRSTMNEQPVSTFGKLNRERLVADKIVWPCKRLGVPGNFVDQWLRNHIPRLELNTLTPVGKKELLCIRDLVLHEFEIDPPKEEEMIWRPLFV